jgi:putative membrane protein
MTLGWFVAAVHLLALGLGLGAIFARARALQAVRQRPRLRTIFYADALWGIAAVLWLVTGLWRAFGGLERGGAYYLQEPLFHAKLGLFGLLVALEIWPMVTLLTWRRKARRGEPVSLARASAMARLSYVETLIVGVIVFLAVGVARGL